MAVYTRVDEERLTALLGHYELGEAVGFEPIAEGVENTNYRLVTSRGRYVLTLFEGRTRRRHLPFFVSLMRHLAGRGVPCPAPVPRRDGNHLGTVAGRDALIATFLPGRPKPDAHRALGEALAGLHEAGMDFGLRRPNDLGPAGWRRLHGSIAEADAEDVMPGLWRRIRDELDDLLPAWPDDLPSATIHADLFPDNVLFENGRVSGIIDFYFACTDSLAYDLAVSEIAWAMDDAGRFDADAAREMEEGYAGRRALSARERDMLPILRRGAALRFLLTRLYDRCHPAPDALVEPKDPLECLRKLDGLA